VEDHEEEWAFDSCVTSGHFSARRDWKACVQTARKWTRRRRGRMVEACLEDCLIATGGSQPGMYHHRADQPARILCLYL